MAQILERFRSVSWVEAALWVTVANIVVFGIALAFGHGVIALCGGRYVHEPPLRLTPRELVLASLCVVVNSLIALLGWFGWVHGWIRIRDTGGWMALLDFFVLFLVMDVLMYVLHRVAHSPWLYGWLHAMHHEYQDPRPLTLFVMNPLEALAFGFLWLAVIGLHSPTWIGMTAYLTANIVIGILGHVGVNPHPHAWSQIPVVGWLSTSRFHHEHHRNKERNLGFYTVVWDRLFRTLA